jgi:hypothetical protein
VIQNDTNLKVLKVLYEYSVSENKIFRVQIVQFADHNPRLEFRQYYKQPSNEWERGTRAALPWALLRMLEETNILKKASDEISEIYQSKRKEKK